MKKEGNETHKQHAKGRFRQKAGVTRRACVCGECTSYWAVYFFTHRRLIAFLERKYLKQVVPLKRHASA